LKQACLTIHYVITFVLLVDGDFCLSKYSRFSRTWNRFNRKLYNLLKTKHLLLKIKEHCSCNMNKKNIAIFLSFYSPFCVSVFNCFSLFFCFFIALPFSSFFTIVFVSVFRLLWVSSLAYPNLLGTERLGCCCYLCNMIKAREG
jgi:hypothetical protein